MNKKTELERLQSFVVLALLCCLVSGSILAVGVAKHM